MNIADNNHAGRALNSIGGVSKMTKLSPVAKGDNARLKHGGGAAACGSEDWDTIQIATAIFKDVLADLSDAGCVLYETRMRIIEFINANK